MEASVETPVSLSSARNKGTDRFVKMSEGEEGIEENEEVEENILCSQNMIYLETQRRPEGGSQHQ